MQKISYKCFLIFLISLRYRGDISEQTSFRFIGGDYLLFHVVNLSFNASVWANSRMAQNILKHIFGGYFKGY
jgi:hypothetical protein